MCWMRACSFSVSGLDNFPVPFQLPRQPLKAKFWDHLSECLPPVTPGAELSCLPHDATKGPKMSCGLWFLAWVMPSLDYPTFQIILAVGYLEFHNKTLHYEKKALAFDTKIECTCKLLEHNISPKNFTIKWWHLSRLKSYNSIHSLLWSRKLKLHLLDIDLETSIFKVTTDQFFMSESYIRGKFPVVLLLKGFHSIVLTSSGFGTSCVCLNPSSVTYSSCATQ